MEKLNPETPDLALAQIERLRELFPECVTEGPDGLAVDFDALKQALSSQIVEGPQERYRLDWPGKREAAAMANQPTDKTLRPARDESVNFDTTQNLFIEGDNLEALKLIQETYLGQVKMIYIDPPYNTGNDFIYRDDFKQAREDYEAESGQRNEEGERLVPNPESRGRFHSDWLSMMYPRLKLAKSLLADDGVIFISIDDGEVANLRRLCDEVFGAGNFRNSFALRRYDKNINRQFMADGLVTFNVGFEYILSYAKSASFKFNPIFREASEGRSTKGYWKGFWNDADRPTMRYDILGFTPVEGQWKWSEAAAREAIDNFIVFEEGFASEMSLEEYWEKTGKEKKFIRRNLSGKGKNQGVEHWIEPSDGVLRNTNWTDVFASKKSEELGNAFDFPKNVEAIKLLLRQSVKANSIILDFFAGSATTAHAVMQLNAEDGGNRRFIMVQLPEACAEDSEAFKAGYKTIAEISKERIRRAGQKIVEGECHEDWNKDIGFRVLKVGESNLNAIRQTPDATSQESLLDAVENIKPDRSEEDLLFDVMMRWGVDLAAPVESCEIEGKTVFLVNEDDLVACFDPSITEDFVKRLTDLKPLKIVFRDDAFASDDVKINTVQIFKQASPDTEVRSI